MQTIVLDVAKRMQALEEAFAVVPDSFIDRTHLARIDPLQKPLRQQFVFRSFVGTNLRFFPGIDVIIQGQEHIPKKGGFILAMNHTDDYNYLPLIYHLIKQGLYGTAWIKGKNYKAKQLKAFFDFLRAIPVPPANYFLESLYKSKFDKDMPAESYRRIKDAFNQSSAETRKEASVSEEETFFFNHMEDIVFYHEQLLSRVGELTHDALAKGLYVLIFPEGSRSVRLSAGRTGVAEAALHTRVPVLPVGCNGGHHLYPPKSLPFAQGPQGYKPSWLPRTNKGKVVYKIGKPLTLDDTIAPFAIEDNFTLLSRESQKKYGKQFRGATQVIMQAIHNLLDEEHRNEELYG